MLLAVEDAAIAVLLFLSICALMSAAAAAEKSPGARWRTGEAAQHRESLTVTSKFLV
jgi:hypothetical protein